MTVNINFRKMESFLTEELINIGTSFAEEVENNPKLGFTKLTDTEKYINECQNVIKTIDKKMDTLLVLGIGGSALGTSMVLDALPDNINKKVIVIDNVDSHSIDKITKTLNPSTTIINIVSKSGGTVEPISQFKYFFNIFEKQLGTEKAIEHCILTTDSKDGVLRKLADKLHFKTLPIPSNVGGRFSILTPAGLFPLAFAGIDISKIIKGAKNQKDYGQLKAVKSAVIDYHMYKQNKNIKILFPYSDRLVTFGQWYLQLFGESLGKRYNNNGEIVNTGQTAVVAKGVTDQHSQLQLYMEGPSDKFIAFFKVTKNKKITIPDTFGDYEGFTLTSGKTFEQLLNAEMEGTMTALEESGMPIFEYSLENVDEETIGELIYLFELQTAITGSLLGINAFDQPGVEAGKIIAKKILSGN